MRLLLYITRQENLSLWQAIQAFSRPENQYLLSHPGVQHTVESAIFRPPYLLQQLEQEPGPLIESFRRFVNGGLKYFDHHTAQLNAILFLLRVGISFETFTPLDLLREETLQFYRKTLKALCDEGPLSNEQRLEIHLHQTYLESQCEQKDPTELFINLFYDHLNNFTYHTKYAWLQASIPRIIRDCAYRYSHLFDNEATRNHICKSIVQNLLKNDVKYASLPLSDWKGSFPQFECGDLVVDFFNGTLTHKAFGALVKITGMFIMQLQGEAAEDFRKEHGCFFWNSKKGDFVSLNEKVVYSAEKKRMLLRNGSSNQPSDEGERVEIPATEIDARGQAFLNYYEYLPWIHYKKSDGSITTYDQKLQCPVMRIEPSKQGLIYTRLDPQGGRLPYQLANLSGLHRTDSLYHYTARYTYHDRILCFVHEKTNEIQEINFYFMKLKFSRDAQGLVSSKQPGFYLIGQKEDLKIFGHADLDQDYDRMRAETNQFEGMMILYNPQTGKWLLLFPNTALTHGDGDFSREVFSNTSGRVGWIHPYFKYDFDFKRNELKPLEAETKSIFYLASLFKMQRDYEKSYKYLKKVKSSEIFDRNDLEALNIFVQTKDYSAPSVAFNLNLCLFIVRNRNLLTEAQFEKKNHRDFYSTVLFWGMENYTTYLHLLNESGQSRVPESLQLSDGDRMKLLLAFQSYYEEAHKERGDWEKHWIKEQPVLDNQFNVYFKRDRKNTVKLEPQELSLRPPVLSGVDKPSKLRITDCIDRFYLPPDKTKKWEVIAYPVRATIQAMRTEFIELYERARNCKPGVPDPFDFTLHALLKIKEQSIKYQIPQLLFWVRHFSDQFQGDEFSFKGLSGDDWDSLMPQLTKIQHRVHSIEKDEKRFSAFVKTVLEAKTEYQSEREFHLEAKRREEHHVPLDLCSRPHHTRDLDVIQKEIQELFHTPYKVIGSSLVSAKKVEEETLFLLKQEGEQVHVHGKNAEATNTIAEKLMKEVILKNDLDYLFKIRPMFNIEQMQHLCRLANEWCYAKVLAKLKEEGTPLIPYDYRKYPEISYFYLKTGKFPRIEQLETYQWVKEGILQKRNRHFQLPTGAGKTDVLNPLFNLLAKICNLMACTCVTQVIYPIDKENLDCNLFLLDENLACLEVGMHMIKSLTSKDLKFIYSQLKSNKSEGRSLIMTRHTFDAFFLLRDLPCKTGAQNETPEERGNRIRWAQHILNFFEEECLLICDESHQNADPLRRAIFGTGELMPIPKEESALLLKLMKPLLGIYPENKVICKDGKDVFEIAHFNNPDVHGAPTKEEMQEMQLALADYYLLHFFPAIPEKDREEFKTYFTNLKAPQPALLKKWGEEDRKMASLVATAGDFLLVLLPDIVRMRTDIDHARSLYTEKYFDVPCHHKMATTAEYESYKTTVLSIKGTYQRGISSDHLRKMLENMIKTSSDEKLKGCSTTDTPTNLRLQSWLKESPFHSLCIEDVDFSNKLQMELLCALLAKKRDVIEYFLTEFCFQGIGNPKEQLFSTTTDFFNGFKHVIAFSATPRDGLSYPRCIKPQDYRKDDAFQVRVRNKLQRPENQQKVIVDKWDEIFSSKLLADAEALIDPRGFFSILQNHELAEKWLKANPALDGILYCVEKRSESVDRKEKICLHLRDGTIHELNGSSIDKALAEQGFDRDKLRLGTIFDPGHTESANILQKPGAKALFFLGDGLTTSHLIQAVGRLWRTPDQSQTISWVIPRSLNRTIAAHGDILTWTDVNENEQEKIRIIINAFQEIVFAIAKPARDELKAAFLKDCRTPGSKMECMIATYQKYVWGLTERSPADAYAAFGNHEVMKKTREALEFFAINVNVRFLYPGSYYDNHALKDIVNAIILDVEAKIKEVSITPSLAVASETEHQQELRTQKEKQQENQCPRPTQSRPLDGRYGEVSIYSPDYLHTHRELARAHLDNPFLTENFYFNQNHMITAFGDDGVEMAKPIDFFIIIIEKDPSSNKKRIWADVDSNEIISTDFNQLILAPKEVENLTHTAFLVSASGQLIQKGCGAITPDNKDVTEILQSPWLQDLVIDAALLKGKIQNPERILERIKLCGWEQFARLWDQTLKSLPNVTSAQTPAFERLKDQVLGSNKVLS